MSPSLIFFNFAFLFSACSRTEKITVDTQNIYDEVIDADNDGFSSTEDCNDGDATINPNSIETCDGFDNDCDGEIDEDTTTTFYADSDDDGFGNPDSVVDDCTAPDGYVIIGSDCDDGNGDSFPGNEEICDYLDNDCDGNIDEDVLTAYLVDSDGDGFGGDQILDSCTLTDGLSSIGGDCNDGEPLINPLATEFCDGIDNDCDGITDQDIPVFFADIDLDGYGNPSESIQSCTLPDGYVTDNSDCDDADSNQYPGADELCNLEDDNCDGDIDSDDSIDALTFYADGDADGYGDINSTIQSCTLPLGYTTDATDCDDGNNTKFPGATEICDGHDNDCNGIIDDGAIDGINWYADTDGDNFGDVETSTQSCSQPTGHVLNGTDCDDGDATKNPNATEFCNGEDDNCDGNVDEVSAVDTTTWYLDSDGDNYGDIAVSNQSCDQPIGYVSDATDCDDNDFSQHPTAVEVCNGEDDDCNSLVDDGTLNILTWYVDSDGDGYGDGSVSTDSCFQPPGYIDLQGDCNDSDGDFHPGATEICDSLDNDCNGIIDDDLSLVGTDQSCPGQDCQDLMVNFGVTDDGNYWIDPDETGTFEIFCDMSNLAGGWTLVANVDDVNDPYFGALQSQPWEGNNVRNESVLPSYTSDISVSTKYASWSNIDATDVYIRYKNSNNYFLCEGLSVVDSLDQLFSITPSSGTCSSECTSYSEDIMPESTSNPVGLNCSDGNEGWIGSSGAENARIGGRSIDNSCCVMNAWLGAAGDRGYSTSIFEKTWGAYSSGAVYDNNIMVFVR